MPILVTSILCGCCLLSCHLRDCSAWDFLFSGILLLAMLSAREMPAGCLCTSVAVSQHSTSCVRETSVFQFHFTEVVCLTAPAHFVFLLWESSCWNLDERNNLYEKGEGLCDLETTEMFGEAFVIHFLKHWLIWKLITYNRAHWPLEHCRGSKQVMQILDLLNCNFWGAEIFRSENRW